MSDFLDVKLAHMIEDAAARRAADLVPLVTALDRIALLELHLRRVLEAGKKLNRRPMAVASVRGWDKAATDAEGVFVAKCKACGATIEFLTTAMGNQNPVDADESGPKQLPDGPLHFRSDGRVIVGEPPGMRSHFQSCPSAAKFRRPKR